MEIMSDGQMGVDQESTTPARSLEVSISFGRFENDLLSWEKWSSFSQNKYLEEVEKCATPGSVAAKKAYFEARNKLSAVKKAEVLSNQMEVCQEMEENHFQNTCASEVIQYDEDVIEENLFGSEMSSPRMNEHPEMETNFFRSEELDKKAVIEATSTKQLTVDETKFRSEMSRLGMNGQSEFETNILMSQETDEKDIIEALSTIQLPSNETIIESETSYPLVVDFRNKDLYMPETEMLNKDTDDTTHESNSEFDINDGRSSFGRIKNEQISKLDLSPCETDQPFSMQNFVSGTAQTYEIEQVVHPFETDAPEAIEVEAILKIAVNPNLLDQFKVDNAGSTKSPSPIEDEYVKLKFAEDIPALKIEKLNVEPACVGELPNLSTVKNARTQKVKPHLQNSSKKVFPANKPNSADNVKKVPVSSVRGPSQISTPKTYKPSMPTVKSASRSLPVSKVKRTPDSAPAVRKLEKVPNATRSTLDSPVASLKSSPSSLSKKGSDFLSSRKKSISPVVTQKQIPKSLHMSLNFGSKISSSISCSTPITEPRKSLFLEKMGDKDIVKRAFRAFQYMPTPLNINDNDTSKKVVRDKNDVISSTPGLQKQKDRLIKKSEVDLNSKKSTSIYTSNKLTCSKEDKRKELKKVAEKTKHLSTFKECRETFTGDQPGSHKRQTLSKSFQDKLLWTTYKQTLYPRFIRQKVVTKSLKSISFLECQSSE